MMVFSCTKKVNDRLKKYKEVLNDKGETDFHNWYISQINIERKNHFLFTHSESLFSFFIYVGTTREIRNLEMLFEEKLREMIIRELSTSKEYIDELLPKNRSYQIKKTNSRSILGSMNDFKNQIKVQLWHNQGSSKSHELIIHYINQAPMGGIKYECPVNNLRNRIEQRINQRNQK